MLAARLSRLELTSTTSSSQASGKFLNQVYDAAVRHFNFDELKVLIIASPGFTKETVHSFLIEEAVVRPRLRPPHLALLSPRARSADAQ